MAVAGGLGSGGPFLDEESPLALLCGSVSIVGWPKTKPGRSLRRRAPLRVSRLPFVNTPCGSVEPILCSLSGCAALLPAGMRGSMRLPRVNAAASSAWTRLSVGLELEFYVPCTRHKAAGRLWPGY